MYSSNPSRTRRTGYFWWHSPNFGLAGKKVEEGEIDHIGEDLIRAENIVSSSGRCVWLDTQGTTDGGHQSGLGGIGWTFLHVCGEGDNPGLSETVFSKL